MSERELDSGADHNEVEPGRDSGHQGPVRRLTLEELVARVEPEHVHGETDWGPDVGKERWWVQP